MLEGVLASVLNRVLSAYVDNLSTSQLNVGIWNGDVKLKNLRLKRTALEKLHLPIDVKEGYLGQLTLFIPWSNLKGKPVRVLIENVSLLASPREASAEIDEEEEEKQKQAQKQAKLAEAELLSQGLTDKKDDEEAAKQNESFISSLVTKIVDNLQITVRNIHIRYQDNISNPEYPFSIGLTLAELSAVSTDENWEPAFVHNSAHGIHKLARLDSLSLYWNTNDDFLQVDSPEELQQKLNDLIPTKESHANHQYILEPVSGAGKLVIRHQATKDTPAMDAQLVFDQIGFILDDEQYRDGICMMDLFHFYARQAQYRAFRPTAAQLEENKPRALFQFAAKAIMNEVHQKHRVWSWDYFKKRRDMRLEYIDLFKQVEQSKKAGSNEAPPSEALNGLHLLENKLEYRDIRLYRSIARREMRKKSLETEKTQSEENQQNSSETHPESSTEKASDGSSQENENKSRGWFSWMWGSSGQSSSKAEEPTPVLDTQQRKELYDAIEWDETKGTSLAAQLSDLPADAVKMHAVAQLRRGFVTLRDHTTQKDILSLVFDDFQGEMRQRSNNLDVSASLGALCVMDGTTSNTNYPQIVHVKGTNSTSSSVSEARDMIEQESDAQDPFFVMNFERNPLDGRADNALSLTMRSMEIVYHRSYIESIIRFFKPPENELELIGALLDVASETLEGIRKETRIGLESALENHKTLDVALDVQAPIIVLPEDIRNRKAPHVVLDAGHIAVRSLLADQKALDAVRAKQSKQYTEQDYRQLEDLMYDRYFIKLDSTQLVVGGSYQESMDSLQSDISDYNLHLLERINLTFTLHSSILPRAPNLTKCKITGNLPRLNVHFSDAKYHSLMRIIDVSIPRSESGASSQFNPQGIETTKEESAPLDLAQARRSRIVEQLRGMEDSAILSDYEGSSESDTSHHTSEESDNSDAEDHFEESQVLVPDKLRALQKTFEFSLTVDSVQGSISKSATEPGQADQLLLEVVFQNFRLGLSVLPYELDVRVNLGSLDLVDKIVKQAPMFQHIITSRPLESIANQSSPTEGGDDAHDLVSVRYLKVSRESPTFLEDHDGVDQSINVDLSTINLMLTRASVLAVYDWIMLTFVPKSQPDSNLDASADSSETISESASEISNESLDAASKMRIKVKLSSIQLRLNDDGSLLSTLTLSTADIAILLRGSTMRIATRVGSLSLRDERQRERADEELANLLSIEGGELADFAVETFDHRDPKYPGYDTSLWLRCGALKVALVTEPIQELLGFFSKFAQMKAVYDAASSAASAQASQLQASKSKVKYDLLVESPIVVLPRNAAKPEQLIAHLGELYAYNAFDHSHSTDRITIQAGLRQIRLDSRVVTEGQARDLPMLQNVEIGVQVQQKEPLEKDQQRKADVGDSEKHQGEKSSRDSENVLDSSQVGRDEDHPLSNIDRKQKDADDQHPQIEIDSACPSKDQNQDQQDDSLRRIHFSASMSNIDLTLTQHQYALLLSVMKVVPNAFTVPGAEADLNNSDTPPLPLANEEENAKAVELVQSSSGDNLPTVPVLIQGHFGVSDITLNLYDDSVTTVSELEAGQLLRFSLKEALFKMHQHPETGFEAEVSLESFSATDTRPSRETYFREVIPASTHDGKQFMLNYSASAGPEANALAIITLDSPKLIFSLDPLFAFMNFITAGIPSEPDAENQSLNTAAQTVATSSHSPQTLPRSSSSQPIEESSKPSFSFRVNIVEPRIILLSSPERKDSEAIVLMVRQVVISQQTVMVISVTQLGMFVWRMNAPKDRQRLLNNVDISVSLDSRSTATGPITSIDVEVETLMVRLTRSDVQLLSSVVENAVALSAKNNNDPQEDPSSKALTTTTQSQSSLQTGDATQRPTDHSSSPSRSESNTDAQLFATREEASVRIAGVQVMVISEIHMLPALDLHIDPCTINAIDWSADLHVHTTLNMWLNSFNLSLSYWEPLIEPWALDVRMERQTTPASSTLSFSAQRRLEINLSVAMLESAHNTLKLLDKNNQIREDKRHIAPFQIRNRTGYRISVWSEQKNGSNNARQGAHRIDDGAQIPWMFGDWKSLRENPLEVTYNRLAVQIEDMPWERLRQVSVGREGETVMTLRPKMNRTNYRILCDVKLESNVKIITFRSTFRIDNSALIPLEVGVLDEDGTMSDTILKIAPGEDNALPIIDAYHRKVRVRPDPGFGYLWSNEAVDWRELMYSSTHKFVCPSETQGEAPFLFQGYAIRDLKNASQRHYPKLTLSLRAPVEVENLLPYDVQYRLFDKNLHHSWSSFLRKGGVSPIHVVELEHLLLLSVEVHDTPFSPSDFAIIASDNPDDFPVEHVLPLVDPSNQKLELRLHYHTYPDSGGAFKVQIYSPYIFLNQSQLPVGIKARMWGGNTRPIAGQHIDKSNEPVGTTECRPFLVSRSKERKNRFVVRVGDSQWSKPLSFDVIGSEVEVTILSSNGDHEAHLGLNVEDGLGKFKLSKVIKLTPRYMVHNHLSETIHLTESVGGDDFAIPPGELRPAHWLHVNSSKHAKIRYANSTWTAPFSMDNIGNVFLRVVKSDEPQHLLDIDVEMNGPVIFIQVRLATGPWPFVLRNETDFTVTFMQSSVASDTPRARRALEGEEGPGATLKKYVLKPRSKMKYAWDYPADPDKYIRLTINGRERVINILEIGALLPFRFPSNDGKGNSVVSLDVRADGESQTLAISPYSESKSNYKLAQAGARNEAKEAGFEAVDVDTTIVSAIKVELAGVGVSLISSKVKEIAYCTFRGLELSYTESQVTTAINVIFKWIQIDNQMYGSIFPIVLYPTVVPKDGKELDIHPTLQASIIRLKDETHGVQHVKYASVLLQELTAELDENFLFAIYDFVRINTLASVRPNDESEYIEHPNDIPEPTDAAQRQDQIYFEILHLQPLALNLSFMATDRVDVDDTESSRTLFLFIFNALVMALGNINDAPVRLNALVMENVRVSMAVLQQRVTYHYGQEFLFQVHRILGSADFLGNPVGLFNNVSSGVADIFYEPYYGLVMHGNRELGFGIARGASNFVKKTVFGVSDSVSKLTGSISKGLAAVTMDRDFQNRWRATHTRNKPRHALYGITNGANSLFTSVASGIEGLALRPLEGAEQRGATGFVQGVGRGLIGAVTKPAAGFFDLASSVTEGLRNTTTVFEQNDIDRVRLPRYIASDMIIRPYSAREAQGQDWLYQLDNGRIHDDQYIAHVDTPGPHGGSTIMLTEHRILYIRTGKLKVLWEVIWPDLSTISLESTGISLVLRGGVMGPFLSISESSTRLWLFKQISGVVQKYNTAHT
ncbi:Vacuolar protein sorting-associated protein 13 [Malassezia psittaci]|uniref:Vacuolar protein sorting-associated protein 13 n=1 Tax=Malassezia psittaci TaxID=1821823 RepID=A0AAF0F8J8_9BASI|nr:Vacuolar protein sorting-associated protein 13 [Malassezia psittaci]